MSGFFDEYNVQKYYICWIDLFCDIINVFTVPFDHFNAPLTNTNINYFIKKKYFWCKMLNGKIVIFRGL